jgi:DnaK suppressor protein
MAQTHEALKATDREALKAALESKRAELLRGHDQALEAATHSDQELPDPMDAATRATDQAELLGLAEHDRVLLGEIDHALLKMADGRYGSSERSGLPIPVARLRALPWARLTADEEEEVERAARR